MLLRFNSNLRGQSAIISGVNQHERVIVEYIGRHRGVENAFPLFHHLLRVSRGHPRVHQRVVPIVLQHAHEAMLAGFDVIGEVTIAAG